MNIIEGHGRVLSAIELGIESIPVITLKGLTEQEKKAYALIHNKLTMNTPFDYDILEQELEEIKMINMSDFSFNIHDAHFFDENSEHQTTKKEKVTVTTDKANAEILRDYLTTNKVKYKEVT